MFSVSLRVYVCIYISYWVCFSGESRLIQKPSGKPGFHNSQCIYCVSIILTACADCPFAHLTPLPSVGSKTPHHLGLTPGSGGCPSPTAQVSILLTFAKSFKAGLLGGLGREGRETVKLKKRSNVKRDPISLLEYGSSFPTIYLPLSPVCPLDALKSTYVKLFLFLL